MFRLIALLAPMVLLMGLGLDLYLPSEHKIMLALNFNFKEIQLTLSIYMYFFGLGQLLMGPITDRFGRKHPLRMSILIYIAGSLMFAKFSDYYVIMTARAMQAFGACGAMVIALALVRDNFEGKDAIRAFTYTRGTGTIAPILAPTFGVFLAATWGWRADFYFLAVFGLIAFCCTYFIAYPSFKASVGSNLFGHYFNTLKQPAFRRYALCAAAVQSTMFGYFSISPIIYINLLGQSEQMFALLFSLGALVFLIAAFGLAPYMAKLGVQKCLRVGSFFFIAAGVLMLLTYHFVGLNIFTLFGPNLLTCIACAVSLGASNTGAMAPFKSQPGKAAGLLGCIEFMLGGFIGSLIVSNVVTSTNPMAYLLIAVGLFITILNIKNLKQPILAEQSTY